MNAANVTNMVNILLTLSVGVTAFAVNILVNAKDHLSAGASAWLIASFVFLFLDALVGVAILFTRMENTRCTIRGAALMRDHPGFLTDEAIIKTVMTLKTREGRLNLATNRLLYVQPALFFTGFICLAISVFITHGSKLV
jgi:hypothetical protein